MAALGGSIYGDLSASPSYEWSALFSMPIGNTGARFSAGTLFSHEGPAVSVTSDYPLEAAPGSIGWSSAGDPDDGASDNAVPHVRAASVSVRSPLAIATALGELIGSELRGSLSCWLSGQAGRIEVEFQGSLIEPVEHRG